MLTILCLQTMLQLTQWILVIVIIIIVVVVVVIVIMIVMVVILVIIEYVKALQLHALNDYLNRWVHRASF